MRYVYTTSDEQAETIARYRGFTKGDKIATEAANAPGICALREYIRSRRALFVAIRVPFLRNVASIDLLA
jgi:hypothetical protein